jgi:hypothetical protein
MQPKRRGRPPKAVLALVPDSVRVRCVKGNVWTSYGKLREGEEATVSVAEAANLPHVEIVE